MSLATSIGREMNVFCEAEGRTHRLSFKSPILLYSIQTADDDGRRALSCRRPRHRLTQQRPRSSETVKALCDKAEQMVREGTVLLVLSVQRIARRPSAGAGADGRWRDPDPSGR